MSGPCRLTSMEPHPVSAGRPNVRGQVAAVAPPELRPSSLDKQKVERATALASTICPESPTEPVTRCALDKLAVSMTARASRAGAKLTYLGSEPLFEGGRVYTTPAAQWLVVPAHLDPTGFNGYPIPARPASELRRLSAAGLDFSVIYIGHELPRSANAFAPVACRPGSFRLVDQREVARLLPPTPVPPRSEALSRRLGGISQGLLRAGAGGAAIAVAGSALLGAAQALIAGGIATAGAAGLAVALPALAAAAVLDPVVLGAVLPPDRPVRTGEHAAWFLLTSWDW